MDGLDYCWRARTWSRATCRHDDCHKKSRAYMRKVDEERERRRLAGGEPVGESSSGLCPSLGSPQGAGDGEPTGMATSADKPGPTIVRIEYELSDGRVYRAVGADAAAIHRAWENGIVFQTIHNIPYRGPQLHLVEGTGPPAGEVEP